MQAFERYPWPGNIRELENLMERAYILETSPVLTPDSFPSEIFSGEAAWVRMSADNLPSLAEFRRLGVEKVERHYLMELLSLHRGSINRSAAAAGVTVRQLHKLMTRHGLRKEEFKQLPAQTTEAENKNQ
jgi:DNA-binding NtrC family response regulator